MNEASIKIAAIAADTLWDEGDADDPTTIAEYLRQVAAQVEQLSEKQLTGRFNNLKQESRKEQ